jgi:hypothetical protein
MEIAKCHVLTNQTDSITTKTIYFVKAILEYLETSLNKVLYCVNVQKLDQNTVKKLHKIVYAY